MKMTVEKRMEVEIDIAIVAMNLPVRYDEDDMPNDYPHRKGEMWNIEVEADTGQICNWPKGVKPRNLCMKVCDSGSYRLVNPVGDTEHEISCDYVPDFIPGKYGVYVAFNIDENGVITNWKDAFRVARVADAIGGIND